MPTPLERVMQTYVLMVDLTPEQEEAARGRLQKFFKGRAGTDQELAIQGLQFLRGARRSKRRSARETANSLSEAS